MSKPRRRIINYEGQPWQRYFPFTDPHCLDALLEAIDNPGSCRSREEHLERIKMARKPYSGRIVDEEFGQTSEADQ